MVELAVERAREAELNKLRLILEQMALMVETGRVEEYGIRDFRFHSTIAQAAHNRFLLHLFTAIRQFLDQFIRESFTLMPEVLNISQRSHCLIFEDLSKRDRKRAVSEMIKHIQLGQETLLKAQSTKDES